MRAVTTFSAIALLCASGVLAVAPAQAQITNIYTSAGGGYGTTNYKPSFSGPAGALATIGPANQNQSTANGAGQSQNVNNGAEDQSSGYNAMPSTGTAAAQQSIDQMDQLGRSLSARANTPKAATANQKQMVSSTKPTPSGPAFGSVLMGTATALSGSELTLKGWDLTLAGVSSPAAGASCVGADGLSYSCGENQRQALARILQQGQVSCLVVGVTSPAPVSCTILGQSVNKGMFYPNN